MDKKAITPDDYIDSLPEERKEAVSKLRDTIKEHLPAGFEEVISYGMLGYVVPHTLYPPGYHCDTKLPLPFLSIASQKNFIALYHMGIYADQELLDWFVEEYGKLGLKKLDMGKSCIRFKDIKQIPYQLIGQLASRMSPEQWIKLYEANLKR